MSAASGLRAFLSARDTRILFQNSTCIMRNNALYIISNERVQVCDIFLLTIGSNITSLFQITSGKEIKK